MAMRLRKCCVNGREGCWRKQLQPKRRSFWLGMATRMRERAEHAWRAAMAHFHAVSVR